MISKERAKINDGRSLGQREVASAQAGGGDLQSRLRRYCQLVSRRAAEHAVYKDS
jgi:hypothetical protein